MTRVCLFLIIASLSPLTAASEPRVVDATDAEELAAQFLSAIKIIEHEHIASLDRQLLCGRLIRQIEHRVQPPRTATRDVEGSSLSDDEALQRMLTEAIKKSLSNPQDSTAPRFSGKAFGRYVLTSLLKSLPGENSLATQQESDVFEQLAGNRYVGIGISLLMNSDAHLPQMILVIPGGPAHRGGVREGDFILEVDRQATQGLPLADILDLLRGAVHTEVNLKVQSSGVDEVREITLRRDVVPIKHTSRNGSVIQIGQVTASTVHELRQIESELGDVGGPIELRLEGVSGSNVHHAVMLADALLYGQPIGLARSQHRMRNYFATADGLFRGRELIVHVDHRTSGTVEWVAAALQDTGRASIAGVKTAGRPFFSESHQVPGTEWVLRLTTGVLHRSDGRSLIEDAIESELPQLMTHIRPADRNMDSQQEPKGGVVPDFKPSSSESDTLGIFPRDKGHLPGSRNEMRK